jgi:argininosuccinate lyase
VARAVVAMEGDLVTDGYAPFLVAFEKATGRKTTIDAATFAELVSPEYFVAVRTRFGGPAPAPLEAAIAGYQTRGREFAARLHTLMQREAAAAQQLKQRFDALKGNA